MKTCSISNISICIYISYQILQRYFQIITHLWYHTPKSNRKTHFGLFLWYIMSFLENIKLISSDIHKIHHKHHLHNLNEVELWYDLYIPSFINDIADYIFKSIVNSDVTNDYKLKIYDIIQIISYLIIAFVFTYLIVIINNLLI